jgi:hypothetical protein
MTPAAAPTTGKSEAPVDGVYPEHGRRAQDRRSTKSDATLRSGDASSLRSTRANPKSQCSNDGNHSPRAGMPRSERCLLLQHSGWPYDVSLIATGILKEASGRNGQRRPAEGSAPTVGLRWGRGWNRTRSDRLSMVPACRPRWTSPAEPGSRRLRFGTLVLGACFEFRAWDFVLPAEPADLPPCSVIT